VKRKNISGVMKKKQSYLLGERNNNIMDTTDRVSSKVHSKTKRREGESGMFVRLALSSCFSFLFFIAFPSPHKEGGEEQ